MKRFATVDAWVAEVNRLARALEDMCEGVHPSAWESDPNYVRLRAQYCEVAAADVAETVDADKG